MDDQNNNSNQEPTTDIDAANSDLMTAQAAEATDTPVEEVAANPFAALKESDPEAAEAVEMKDEDAAEEATIEEPSQPASISSSENSETGTPEVQTASESESASESSDESESPVSDSQSPSEEPSTHSTQAEGPDSSDSTPTVPTNPNARWYVVHTFAGHENKVAAALRQRIEAEHLENLIYDILVPTQDKIEIKGGKKETVKEKIFPGYILIKMELSDLSWLAVRTTQGVTSFIGAGNKPTPISEAEVATIVKFTSQGASPTFKDVFMVDDTVKIVDGPFAEFIGKVDSVDKEKGRVRVLVSIFGRETPVELDFLQVQKL